MDKPPKQQWCIVARTSAGYPCLVYGPFHTIEGAKAFADREFKGSSVKFDILPSIPPFNP